MSDAAGGGRGFVNPPQIVSEAQFIRKVSLVILKQGGAPDDYDNRVTTVLPEPLDLSNMHFQFSVKNWDEEGPTNCVIRIFNLKPTTVQEIIKFNYSQVVLQAGYNSSFGVIFKGDIKQFRVGKLDQRDTYLDILAADGDIMYNFAVANATLSKEQNNATGKKKVINDTASKYGVTVAAGDDLNDSGGIVEGLRGKVLFGMLRTHISDLADTLGATWSIQNGKIVITPLTGVLPGTPIVLNSATGLIGIPESTQSGIIAKCLISPRINIGSAVKIDNASINQTLGQDNIPGLQVPFNQWIGSQNFASVAADGMYRVYGCEHEGDTRGTTWYSTLTCLTIDGSSKNVKPYGL